MLYFEAGIDISKAAVQIQMCGKLPQSLRGPAVASNSDITIVDIRAARDRSRRGGRFHVREIVRAPSSPW
jgi:hypothetical protein